MHRHQLTDEQWALVQPLLPERTATTGRPPSDPRLMLDGIFWILSTGAAWRDLPERFGPWQTVYDHFSKWRKRGVFAAIVEALQVKLDREGLIDWDLWCVDGASVRATRAAAAGADKKVAGDTRTNPRTTRWAAAAAGFGSKFHLVTDGKGTPLAVEVTAGQVHESTCLESVVATFIASRQRRRRRKPRASSRATRATACRVSGTG